MRVEDIPSTVNPEIFARILFKRHPDVKNSRPGHDLPILVIDSVIRNFARILF